MAPIRKRSAIWNHFSETGIGKATCGYCSQIMSIPNKSVGNLKRHLRAKHPTIKIATGETYEGPRVPPNHDDESEEDTKLSEVRTYFDKATGSNARCLICQASVPNYEEDLRRHMKKHPKKLNDDQDSDGGNDDDDQQEAFTEVVYLDEEDFKSQQSKFDKHESHYDVSKKKQAGKSIIISKKKKRTRVAVTSSSEEETVMKQKPNSDLKKFGDYIICLLEKLPHDVCMKVQMNIINMIVTAKLSNTNDCAREPTHIIPTRTAPVTIQSVTPEYYVLQKDSNENSPLQCPVTETVPNGDNVTENHNYSITVTPTQVSVKNDVTISDKHI